MKHIDHLHFLRSIAVLSVFLSHLFTRVLPSGSILEYGGQFGVGVFFLISGFLIPMVCERGNSLQFVVRRSFRVYPVAILWTLIIFFVIKNFDVSYPGVTKEPSFGSLIATFFMVWDIFKTDTILFVFWTVLIEEKFYLFCLIVKLFDKELKVKFFLISFFIIQGAFLICGFILNDEYYSSVVTRNLSYINFILIGSVYFYYYSKKISFRAFLTLSALFFFLYLIFFLLNPALTSFSLQSQFVQIEGVEWKEKYFLIRAYSASVLFFFFVVYLSKSWNLSSLFGNKNISFFADISFSLYVVHQSFNYSPLFMQLNTLLRQSLIAMISILVAYCIYKFYEKPLINFSKKIC